MTSATAGSDLTDTRGANRLREAVQRLATRATAADADRVLRVAGPVLLPTGAIMILLGWYGAANTTRVFLQIPYLISGGLLGLGLMFAGGFLYFARWLTDLLDQTRHQAADAQATAERTAAALEHIESLLRHNVLAPPTGAIPPTAAIPVVDGPSAPSLVATDKGTMAHRPECRLVAGRPTHPVTFDGTLGRCQICRPPLT